MAIMKSIKKIAVRGGHNFLAKGACALIDETTEDRKVYKALLSYLRTLGYEVLDVTPSNCDVNTDLAYGVNKAEQWGADLFLSIHFDKAYDSYSGNLGTGTWIYATGGQAEVFAKRIVDRVASGTGLSNRGVKCNPKLYELRKTSMPAVIVEVCFCEATEDVRKYRNAGADKIGKLIAEGVAQRVIDPSVPSPNTGNDNFVLCNATTKNVSTQLNIRAKGTTSAPVLGTIPANAEFNIKWVDSDYLGWYYIDYKGTTGYVHQDYVKKYLMAKTKNVSSALNVRAKGNTSSDVVGQIYPNEIFRINYVDSDYLGWYYITTSKGVNGYVCDDYVDTNL